MKNIFKLKNSLIMTLGILLCLVGFIGCSSTNNSSINNSGQVVENSNSNNVPLTNPNGSNNNSILILIFQILLIFQITLVKTI